MHETRLDTPLRKLGDRLLVLGFTVAIAAPLAVRLVAGEAPFDPAREFRRPAPRPEWSWNRAALRAWPRDFEAWYGDHFALRSTLIRWHNVVKLFGFGVSPTDELVVGDEHWLFTTRANSMAVFRGVDPFSERDLTLWRRVLEERRAWCAERGIEYLYVIAPNKEGVYPEYLPERLNRVGPTRREQLVAWIGERSEFPLLDLTGALVEARALEAARGEVFFPYGTHWNDLGALYGYRAFIDAVAERVPSTRPRPMSDFEVLPTDDQGDSWAERLYMEDLLVQRNFALRHERRARVPEDPRALTWVSEVDDESLPSAVIFHDSFGEQIRPLLAEHFRRATCVWDADFNAELIESERPDVVLHLLVERALRSYYPSTSPLDTTERLAPLFEGSQEVLFRAGAGGEGLQALEGLQLVPDGEGLVLRSSGGGMLLLPPLEVPAGTWPVIELDLELPQASRLDLEYLTVQEPVYSRRARAVRRDLPAGRSRLLIRLMVPDLIGSLRLRPGTVGGDYRVHSIEARAVGEAE